MLIVVVFELAAQLGAPDFDRWLARRRSRRCPLTLSLADGKTRWPPAATPIALIAVAVLALAAAAFLTRRLRAATRRRHADRAAR